MEVGSASTIAATKRQRTLSKLRAIKGCSKTALAKVLRVLDDQGELTSQIGAKSERNIRKNMQSGITELLGVSTPYGSMMETLKIDEKDVPPIEFINPFALLWVLADKKPEFWSLLCDGRCPLSEAKLLLYIDEVTPGNPLRPEKSRCTQCIYWTFADLPSHVLSHSEFWFVFTTVRSTIVNRWPGKVSGLMRHVLLRFFGDPSTPNFREGVVLQNADRSFLFRASFAGFLSDEKALKEIFALKGASGTKFCPTCSNIVQHMRVEQLQGTSLVDIACSNPDRFEYHTNESFYSMVDFLQKAIADGEPRSRIAKLEQMFGLLADPHSILCDDRCRSIVRPVDHYLRDWMHTIVSHGVAGTQTAMLLAACRRSGIAADRLTRYTSAFVLPKARGSVSPTWFDDRRVADDHMRSFASEQLNMVPIILAFLEDVVEDRHSLDDHVRCYAWLWEILSMFSAGPSLAYRRRDLLRKTILDHHRLYADLYPDGIKPKWHHMLHLPEGLSQMGANLSCFVMERKHRVTKAAALSVFRHFEHTVLTDLAHWQLEGLLDGSSYPIASLINPQTIADTNLARSTRARLPIGEIRLGDMCWSLDGRVCRVDALVADPDDRVWVKAAVLQPLPGGRLWSTDLPTLEWLLFSDLVAPLTWAPFDDRTVRVCAPVIDYR